MNSELQRLVLPLPKQAAVLLNHTPLGYLFESVNVTGIATDQNHYFILEDARVVTPYLVAIETAKGWNSEGQLFWDPDQFLATRKDEYEQAFPTDSHLIKEQ